MNGAFQYQGPDLIRIMVSPDKRLEAIAFDFRFVFLRFNKQKLKRLRIMDKSKRLKDPSLLFQFIDADPKFFCDPGRVDSSSDTVRQILIICLDYFRPGGGRPSDVRSVRAG